MKNQLISVSLIILTQLYLANFSYAEDEVSEALKAEKEKTAILQQKQAQAEAMQKTKAAEALMAQQNDAELALLQQKQALAEAMQKTKAAEALIAQQTDEVLRAQNETALLEQKKKQQEYQSSIAASELTEATAGVSPTSKPLTGAVEGTVTSHVPSIIAHQNLRNLAQKVATDLSNLVNGKTLIINASPSRGSKSLAALQVRKMMDNYNLTLAERIRLNEVLIPQAGQNPELDDARMGVIAGIGAASAAVGALADIVGLFKSEYKAVITDATVDQSTLDIVLAEALSSVGGTVKYLEGINWERSKIVESYVAISDSLAKLGETMASLDLMISIMEEDAKGKETERSSAKTKLAQIEDSNSAEYVAQKNVVESFDIPLKVLDTKIREMRQAKAKSDALQKSVEAFRVALTATQDGKGSLFYETALQEEVDNVDFYLIASIVGAGGEGYIERSLFWPTKMSVLSGLHIGYRLVAKDGTIMCSGLEGQAYGASYPIKKPQSIEVDAVEVQLPSLENPASTTNSPCSGPSAVAAAQTTQVDSPSGITSADLESLSGENISVEIIGN